MSRPLRVLLVTIDYPPPPGGIQTVTKNLEQGLEQIGHQSQVLHLPSGTAEKSGLDAIPRPSRVYGLRSIKRRDYIYMNCLYRKTVERIEHFDPDVVHAMHINNWAALVAANEYDIPTVLSVHALELQNGSLARTAISDADRIHTPSQYTASLVRDILPDAESYVVSPSIRLSTYREKTGEDSSSGPVVCLSRFVERKNIDTVIRAWKLVDAEIKDGRSLVVVGDGPNRDQITKLAADTDDIQLTGWISEDEKYELLAEASGFVLVPGQNGYDVEGFGIVFIEAQAARTPIVGSKRGGIPEAIGNAGILVDDEYDPEEVASAIESILADESVRSTVLKAAEERIGRFDIKSVSMDHMDQYRCLIQ